MSNPLTEFRLRCDPRHVPLTQGFLFFAERVLKIRVLGPRGWELVPFRLNAEQVEVLKVIERDMAAGRGSRIIVLKSRKLGISTLVQGLQFYLCAFLPAQKAVVIAHLQESTEEIVTIAATMGAECPAVLAPYIRPLVEGHTFKWPNGSTMRIATQGSDDRLRGSSPSSLHMSEVGSWHKKRAGTTGDEPIQAALGALESVGEGPALGTIVVMESTAKGAVGPFFNRWHSAQNSQTWTPLFFPWQTSDKHRPPCSDDDDALLEWARRLTQEQKIQAWLRSRDVWVTEWARRHNAVEEWARRAVEYHLTPPQVRWALAKCEEQGTLERFDEEYPLSPEHAFLASGRPVFKRGEASWIAEPQEVLRCGPLGRIKTGEVGAEALRKLAGVVPGGEWEFYRLPEPGWTGRYVVTADASGGIGMDYACIQVFDRVEVAQVAEFLSPTCPPSDFASEVETVCKLYYGAQACPELNNHGHAVVAMLWDRGWRNLFRRQIRDRDGRMEKAEEASMQYGWDTTPVSRAVMMENVVMRVRERTVRLYSQRLRYQLETLIRDKRERIDHAPGEHDDAVVALAIALQVHEVTTSKPESAAQREKRLRKPKPVRTNQFLGARGGTL